MSKPTLLSALGLRSAKPRPPRFRSWDIRITDAEGQTYTETNPRKIDAQASMDHHLKQGRKVEGPFGNTKAM